MKNVYPKQLKKLRVLYLIAQLSRGGQERQLYYLLSILDRKNIEPLVYVWNLQPQEANYKQIKKIGIKIYGSAPESSALKKLLIFRKFVLQSKVDLIQSYTFYLNFAACFAATGIKTKAIGGLRHILSASMEVHGNLWGLLNSIFPRTTVVNNYSGAIQLKKRFGWLKRNQIYVISNKINLSQFYVLSSNEESDIVKLVSVSSISYFKRLDILVEVIENLIVKGYRILHTHVGDGKLRSQIQTLIHDKTLDEKFILLGEIDDVNLHLAECDIFLHCADAEGMPNVIMEAMACGRPVVSTNCGDVRYLIEDGKTGFIVPTGDVNRLTEKTERLIQDKNLRKKMGKAGRKFAEKNFILSKLYEETYQVYCKVLKTKHP